ncbi:MAG TPA: TonB family protein [Gemmatimonadaceae bacterium]|jgi:TonB family protein
MHALPSIGSAVSVSATSDGLVEMTVDARNVQQEHYPREGDVVREFFDANAVLAWVDSVTMLMSWLDASQPDTQAPWTPTLGHPMGRQYQASAWNTSRQRNANLSLLECNHTGSRGMTSTASDVLTTIAAFRRAALEARNVRSTSAGRPPNADTYYQHAVGCPARPDPANPSPAYPDVPLGARRSYQALTQFVVDFDGAVDLSTVQFSRSTDPRYAAAVRSVMPKWRFSPATRRGMRVRQLVHMPIEFKVPAGERPTNCPATGVAGVIARPITPDGRVPKGLDASFFRRIARALGDMPIAETFAGRTIRFIYARGDNVSSVREWTPSGPRDLPPDWIKMVQYLPLGIGELPGEFLDDAIEVEIEFTSRCDNMYSVPLRVGTVSFVPQDDGTVQISNVDETGSDYVFAEQLTRHDYFSAEELKRWFDTTAKLMAGIDTAAWRTGKPAPDYLPNAPALRHVMWGGMRLSMNGYGMVMGGPACAATSGYLEIMPEYFSRVKRAAESAADAALRAARRERHEPRVYFEHELTCAPEPARDNPQPVYPSINLPELTSVEVVARFIVDTLGKVEANSIEILPGADARIVAATVSALGSWRFYPGSRAGRRAKALVHLPIVIRPADADATTLARRPELRYPQDTLQRTVFYKPDKAGKLVDRPMAATRPDEWAETVRAMQPYVDQARATWPNARARFMAGLPKGHDFFVTVRLSDLYGHTEQVFVRVERIDDATITGRIQSDIGVVAGYRRGDVHTLAERDLIDWTIVRPDGSEEGNVVGKFLDTYRPHRWR